MGILSNVNPKEVFYYFEEICQIPHGSRNTKGISDYCVNFAKAHKLKYIQDTSNNIIIFKSGSAGYENSSPVIIQGHLDMVCEKDADCSIDFEKDPLDLYIEDNFVKAKGTTLGGDDGIAVAYALAILASDTLAHPPIEAVFTVDEEIGMLGAMALDCSPLKGKTMLNIDSEDEGHLLVSCAGGITATCHLPIEKTKIAGKSAKITVTDLQGGHSGVEIDKGRGNACQILGRLLYKLYQKENFNIISVDGGLKDNAIPREAHAEIIFSNSSDTNSYILAVEELDKTLKSEYSISDPSVSLKFTEVSDSTTTDAIDNITTKKVINCLINLPGGIQKMSMDIEGLVQTSLNLGILSTLDEEILFSFAVRSNVESEKHELTDKLTCFMDNLGGNVTFNGQYPAWEYKSDSKLRELMCEIYQEQYGEKPIVEALHAGVECGIFSHNIKDLDVVAFGPDIIDIHTPKEHLDIDSVERTWNYIIEILKRLK